MNNLDGINALKRAKARAVTAAKRAARLAWDTAEEPTEDDKDDESWGWLAHEAFMDGGID